jgi:RimJ/RimL family protein N-acetyltransferase
VLTPPGPEDDAVVAAVRSDPETLRYLPFMPTSMSADEWRAEREANSANDEIWKFHVHLANPETAQPALFVGQCGIMRIDAPNRCADIGIIIPSRLHRTGIATEALYLTLSHAFEHPDLKLHRVQFVTSSTNVQMRGWLERFGIEVEYRMREAWTDGQGGWLDSMGYSILEVEWPPLKAKMEEKLSARLGPRISNVLI